MVVVVALTLTACAQPSAISVEGVLEPRPTISAEETFTAAFEIRGERDGNYKALFESSPKDYEFSGAVVLEGVTEGKGGRLGPYYYKWGDKVSIAKGEKQILHVSLSPGGKALDPRGETFSVRITFLSGEWKYSEEYQIKVE